MNATTSTALALLLGLTLPAAAQQQPAQQPTEPAAEVRDEQPAAATGAAPAGAGQEMQDEATVATVDHLVLTTAEGERYTLAEGAPVQGLEPGTRVRITYREQDGEKVVTGLEPAPQ